MFGLRKLKKQVLKSAEEDFLIAELCRQKAIKSESIEVREEWLNEAQKLEERATAAYGILKKGSTDMFTATVNAVNAGSNVIGRAGALVTANKQFNELKKIELNYALPERKDMEQLEKMTLNDVMKQL